jgi:membrane protein implicated in regulation of membrane protease activity
MECIWKVGIVCNESIVNLPFFYWLISGFTMVVMEFFIPGIFIIFLGLGAIFTGMILFFVPIGFGFQILIWVISSSIIILSASQFIKNLFPSTQSYSESANRDDYIGKEVVVVEKVEPNSMTGRVHLQGTEWKATSLSHVLEVGDKARVYDRDNLTLIIEKI